MTVRSLCVGLLVTPLGILVALGLAVMTRGFAASLEAELARSLLGAPAAAPPPPPKKLRGLIILSMVRFRARSWASAFGARRDT